MGKAIFFIILILLIYSSGANEKNIQIPSEFRSFFNTYCIECHNDKKQKGKVRLDQHFSFKISSNKDADRWQKILGTINSMEMPPEDEVQPKPAEKEKFLEMLSNKLVDARKLLNDSGNKTIMRRLNQQEYFETMKSLLGVYPDVSSLPQDTGSHFDTNGGDLFMSPDQIEQYLKIARATIAESFKTHQRYKVVKQRIQVENSTNKFLSKQMKIKKKRVDNALAWKKSKDPQKKPQQYGFNSEREITGVIKSQNRDYEPLADYFNHPSTKKGVLFGLVYPVDNTSIKLINVPGSKKKLPNGYYKIRALVGKIDSATEERSYLDFGYKAKKGANIDRRDTFHITASWKKPQIVETTIYINSQNNIVAFGEKQTRTRAQFIQHESRRKSGSNLGFSLWMDWVEWEGPLEIDFPASIKNIYKCLKKPNQKNIKYLLTSFAKTAFRGDSVSSEYIDKLYSVYKQKLLVFKKPQKAIIEPLAIILTSPSFLYISENSANKEPHLLSQRELAIRMAYFLWRSQPDEELYKLANRGKLHDELVLKNQIDRMMGDQRFDNSLRSFTHQWLHMDRLSFFQFDMRKFPHFDETMKWNVAEEVYQTMKTIVSENLNINNLIKSDFVVINSLLASHYDIPNVSGAHFRKVKLPKNSVRGGLTGMAAIHAMGSDGVDTSPVERGAWVLRKILNTPPPPAPANVPQLSKVGKELTIRQMLKAHQSDPQCRHCHIKIDPIGLGMENFDAIGRWRTKDNRNKTSKLIDPSGTLYNGPSFQNYLEMRDLLYSKQEDFAVGLITHLLQYSLGRTVGFSDQDLVKEIYNNTKKNGSTLRTVIHSIIKSKPFQTKN